jgi:hypothetical protein
VEIGEGMIVYKASSMMPDFNSGKDFVWEDRVG